MTILVKEIDPHIVVREKNRSPNRHTKKLCVCVVSQPVQLKKKHKNNRNYHWLHKIDRASWYGKGKPMWTCLKCHCFQKEVQFYVILWVNDPTPRLCCVKCVLNQQFGVFFNTAGWSFCKLSPQFLPDPEPWCGQSCVISVHSSGPFCLKQRQIMENYSSQILAAQ